MFPFLSDPVCMLKTKVFPGMIHFLLVSLIGGGKKRGTGMGKKGEGFGTGALPRWLFRR